MATVIDALLITFGLDPSGIEKGAEEGKSALDGLKSTALKVFAVIGGAVAVKAMISNFSEGADAAGKLADALGEDMVEMQAFGRAAALEGGSVEQFNGSIKSLNKGMVELAATGGGKSAKIFEALGISATDAAGKVRPTTDVLLELSDKFQDLSAQEAAGLGEKLGLDAGTIGLLRKGRVEIEAATKAQKELGVYTKEDAEIAAKFNDQVQDMGTALGMVAAPIIQMVLPALEKMADWVKKAAIVFREQLKKINEFMKEHGTVVVVAVGVAATFMAVKYRQAILQATAAMIRLGVATVIANLPLYLMIAAIALVSAAIGLLVEDFMVWMEGGESAFGGVYQAVADFWAKLKPIFDAIGELFGALWDLGLAAAQIVFDKIAVIWNDLWAPMKQPAEELFNWLGEKLNIFLGMFDKVKELAGKVKGWFGGADEEATGFIEGLTGKVKAVTQEIKANDSISPAAAAAGAGAGQKTVTVTQSVSGVTINTQATDGKGVAAALNGSNNNDLQKLVNSVDSGVAQ